MAEPESPEPARPPVIARMICPVIPNDVTARRELEEDLQQMGCIGLITRPWNLRNDEIIRELVEGAPNQYELTVRGRKVAWTEDVWARVYSFRKYGQAWAGKGEKYAVGKFHSPPHSKEGYAILDCIEERHRQILDFLIPIIYPGKPTRVTVMVANTIFKALEDRVVHWGRIMHLVVTKLTNQVKKSKYNPLSPYMFHLYKFGEVLTPEESAIYDTGCELLKYGLTHELQEERNVRQGCPRHVTSGRPDVRTDG
jgi:hypothetical protein